jgi:hypothetical protein
VLKVALYIITWAPKLQTSTTVVIRTDCTCSRKSKDHTITTATAACFYIILWTLHMGKKYNSNPLNPVL